MTPALLERPCSLAPAPEDATRREFITGIGAAALAAAFLAACRDDAGSAPDASTHSITNKYGTYAIPTDPQRLVLMENRVELETATALGMTPVAIGKFYSFTGGSSEHVAPWVPFTLDDQEVFMSFKTDIEYLITLKPDLIMSGAFWLDGTDPLARSYDALSKVAPVIPIGLIEDWRADLQQVAGWLGREDHLAKTFKEFDDLRDGIKEKHASRLAGAHVAMGSAEDSVWLVSMEAAGSPAAVALGEIGGRLMPFSDPSAVSGGWLELSWERLNELDRADAILMWAPDEGKRNQLLAHPLWQQLPAVKAGRAVVSPQNVGSGALYTYMECMRLWDQVYSTLA